MWVLQASPSSGTELQDARAPGLEGRPDLPVSLAPTLCQEESGLGPRAFSGLYC